MINAVIAGYSSPSCLLYQAYTIQGQICVYIMYLKTNIV